MSEFLAFDLETVQTDIPEGDDLMDHLPTLGISCAATLASDGDLKLWYGLDSMTVQQCRDLVLYLLTSHYVDGYTIVGFNSCSFDFQVLATESGMWKTCKKLALNHIDIAFAMFAEKGFMAGLQSVCQGMGLPGKSGSGADAPWLWAEGKREEVLAYVAMDAKITMSVFQEIQKRDCVEWVTKKGNIGTWFPRSGKLLTVKKAMALPEPNVSWMKKDCLGCGKRVSGTAVICSGCGGREFEGGPWSRDKFVGWLEKEK